MRNETPEKKSGLALELDSVAMVARALKRLPNDRARVRVMQSAIAFLEDRDIVKVTVTKAPWRDAFKQRDDL